MLMGLLRLLLLLSASGGRGGHGKLVLRGRRSDAAHAIHFATHDIDAVSPIGLLRIGARKSKDNLNNSVQNHCGVRKINIARIRKTCMVCS